MCFAPATVQAAECILKIGAGFLLFAGSFNHHHKHFTTVQRIRLNETVPGSETGAVLFCSPRRNFHSTVPYTDTAPVAPRAKHTQGNELPTGHYMATEGNRASSARLVHGCLGR